MDRFTRIISNVYSFGSDRSGATKPGPVSFRVTDACRPARAPSRRRPGSEERDDPGRSAPLTTLEIRLLGGFQVLRDGAACERFESQRVRALLAHLACHRDRPTSRDRLAALLWPDEDPAAARRNLRQAIYNLRTALGPGGRRATTALLADHQTLQLDPAAEVWLDVEAFERSAARGLAADGPPRVRELTRAAQLYRGDFLLGFHLDGSETFEDWLIAEQERLRETAIQALRALAATLTARGEYRFAVRHARQLVEMDPLSEEAQRELMRLYALSGRRERALAQFEDLSDLLERELGVQPVRETQELYRAILAEETPPAPAAESAEPLGPFVPQVGRGEATRRLRESFQRTLTGGARLVLIEGEAGIGKTRLAKTTLNELTSKRRAAVLQGRCYDEAPTLSFQPFAEAIHGTAWEDLPAAAAGPARELLDRLSAHPFEEEDAPRPSGTAGEPRVPELVARLLAGLCRGDRRAAAGAAADPVVVYLDDLHWADASTVALLDRLLDELAGMPVWFLGTWDSGAAGPRHPLHELARRGGAPGARIDPVPLGRLASAAVEEIAASLLSGADAERLAGFLTEHGEGLPLSIVELINLLVDEGILEAVGPRRWSLSAAGLAALAVPNTVDELLLRRVHRLPSSARQLLTLASVIGQTFDVGQLQRAASEHVGVVEIGIELMLERWLIRQFPRSWAANPRERDLVLWARGARRGTFEFASFRIRRAVYLDQNPLRRRQLHGQVAAAFEGEPAEVLAHHWERAGEPRRALPHLRQAAERAAALDDAETAADYCERALTALGRAEAETGDDDRWDGERQALTALRDRLAAVGAGRS